MEKLACSHIAGRNAEWCSHFQKQSGSSSESQTQSYATEQLHSYVATPTKMKIYPNKDTHMNVHCNSICSNPKVERPQMSISQQMDKLNVVNPYNIILSIHPSMGL